MEATLTAYEALRLFRERAGLTQFATAKKLGITQPNLLSLIETGKYNPNAKLVAKIEEHFAIPASEWKAAA